MLMVGYLEGIGSERGIAWRCADSPQFHGLRACRQRTAVFSLVLSRVFYRRADFPEAGAGLRTVKLDRERPKKGSNDDWVHPHDPEARITKMKDGRTRLAHKLEQAVGRADGGRDDGAGDGWRRLGLASELDEAERQLAEVGAEPREVVADKGYHSQDDDGRPGHAGCGGLEVSEPNRGRRNSEPERAEADLPNRGKRLPRTFAHL